MKCMGCGKANYVQKQITDEVDLDGGPQVKIKGVNALVCPQCGDILMDAATSARRTQSVLAALIQEYSPSLQIPGKVAKWIRKSIDLSATQWAEQAGGIDPSAFSQAAQRNSTIDRYAAFVLLARASDFLSGTHRAGELIQATHELEKYLNPELLKHVEVA